MEKTRNELKPPRPQQEVDRISELPDGVQIHILSFLDTRDAVRTAVLSRRWHRTWAHVPHIKLHLIRVDDPTMLSLDGTLASHAAPAISKFELRLEHCESLSIGMVDRLIRRAATRHVEYLSLDLSGLVFPCKCAVTDYLYSQRSLRELRTASCNYFATGMVNWGSLRVLDVGGGHIREKIGDVLSGCPSLESLSLCRVQMSGEMRIVHDKLKRLRLDNCYFDFWGRYRESLEFHLRAPQLEELEILGNWEWTSCKLIDILSFVRVRLILLFRLSSDDDNRMFVDALKVLLERVQDCQELVIEIHCQGDLFKMVTEFVYPALSQRKCLVLKVPIDESSDDEVLSEDE